MFSSYFWMSFYFPPRFLYLLISALMFVCLFFSKIKIQITGHAIGLIGALIAIFAAQTIIKDSVTAQITFFGCLPAVFVYILPKPRQEDLLVSITKWIGVFLGISLFIYFVLIIFPSLPSLGVFTNEIIESVYGGYENYFFFLKSSFYDAGEMYRFNGPFLEPGHLGCVCTFLIYANRYRFKEYPILWVLVVCVIFSFSLAGYVILGLGYIMVKLRSFGSALAIAAAVAGIYMTVTVVWNEGDNPVNNMIFARLEYDQQRGIKGNNRVFRATTKYFNKCVEDGTIWLGAPNADQKGNKIRGAGYKIYMLRNGAVMALLMALFYILLINPKANKRYAWSFFIIVVLTFLQRGYPTWYSWLMPYAAGIGITRGEQIYALLPKKPKKDKKKGKRKFRNSRQSNESENQKTEMMNG